MNGEVQYVRRVYPEQRLRHFSASLPPRQHGSFGRRRSEIGNETEAQDFACLAIRRHGQFGYSIGAPGASTKLLVYIVGY